MPDIILPAPGPHMLDKLASPARHKILCMGRRWRKTTLGVIAAVDGHGPRDESGPMYRGALQGANVWIIDQNHPSATTLWYAMRGMLKPIAAHVSEADRRVLLHNGGAVTVKSAANPDSLVGDFRGIDAIVMNEAAKFSPLAWQKALRPALADTKGWSIWPSTPEGTNYFFDLFNASANLPDWARWQEPSTANPFFDLAEIEAARKEGMPENLIRSEFYAEFIQSGAGRTYHEFTREDHVQPFDVDPALPLDLCVSFGIAPAAWLVTQGQAGRERAIAEIVPPSGEASTRAFAQAFRQQFPRWASGQGVRLFGEVGKGAAPSDFEAIRAEFPKIKPMYQFQPYDEKDRVNATNATLRNRYGDVGGFIAPACERLIRDLEGTRNADASYRVDHKVATLGHYAAAWGAKLLRLYPAIAETVRAVREERNEWGFPIATPEQKRCYSLYWAAVRRGEIVRPKACEKCGKAGKIEADHRDHSKPLEVTHLCRACHFAAGPATAGPVAAMRH